jgi:hypothetical protein
MALEFLTAKVVAMAIAPIMPKFGQRLFSDLTGEAKMEWNSTLLLCNGGVLIPDQGTIYFETINDSKDSVKHAAKAA